MKRILFLIAAIIAAMSVQASTYYGFKIGGVSVNSDNCDNVTGSTITSGTVKYDHSSKTVTLTGVTISRTGSNNRAIYNESNPGLTVKLVGTNNLGATDAAPVRFERHTTVIVTAGSTVTITGGSEGGVYITNHSDVAFKGYGTVNITATSKGGIEGSNDNNNLSFQEGINATIKGGGGDLLDLWRVAFAGDSKVTLLATGNSSNPNVKNVDAMVFTDNQCVLAPMGASYSESAKSIVLNSSNVYNKDVYISNDYVAFINSTNFPNANFRNYLLTLFPKGYITSADVANTTTLDVSDKSISSLTGIAFFTALTNLDCSGNTLTSLNVTKNTQLTKLTCSNNRLSSLNLTYNTKLTQLYCEVNQLTTLNLSKNVALTTVVCYGNNINGSGAESFVNNLPQRTTTGTIRFTVLNGATVTENNRLLIPQVQTATAKKWDVQCCSVSSANPWYSYEGEIPVDETYFPDNNFRSWVSSNCDSNGNGYLTPSELSAWSINLESKSISSLQGIEYFTELEKLWVDDNNLTSLDLSKNTKLKYLNCISNNLTALNVSGCPLLETLMCSLNSLQQLNLTNNSALTELSCGSNQLQQLNLTPNTALQKLSCNNNQLTSLILSTQSIPQNLNAGTIPLSFYGNRLDSDAVDLFIASLDDRPTRTTWYIFNEGDDDQKMTKAQVQTSRVKGWWPKHKSNGTLSDYEGEDDAVTGDINGDGTVDGADVSALLEMVLSGGLTDEQKAVADLTGDGEVDGADVSALLEIVLSGE